MIATVENTKSFIALPKPPIHVSSLDSELLGLLAAPHDRLALEFLCAERFDTRQWVGGGCRWFTLAHALSCSLLGLGLLNHARVQGLLCRQGADVTKLPPQVVTRVCESDLVSGPEQQT